MDRDTNARLTTLDPLTRAVLNGCEHGLCIVDDQGCLVGLNGEAERLLGDREEALRGRPLAAELGLHPAAITAGEWLDSAKLDPADCRRVARWRRPDGSLSMLRCRIEPVLSGGHRAALLRLEAAMPAVPEPGFCDIESNFRAILDTITDSVIVIDERGIIHLLNPAAERLFGYPAAEAIGQNVKMLMPSPDRERHDQYLENYRHTHVKKIIGIGREVMGQRRDGSVFPMYLSIGELQRGTQRMFVGIIHDLTARKLAEDKLTLLSRAVDQSPAGILITDQEGRIEYVNRGFTRLTGYGPQEAIGQSLRMLRSGRMSEASFRGEWNSLRAGEEWHGEVQGQRRDGETYWALETVTPIRDATGKVARFLAMQQDMTQQKRDREALQESERRFRLVADMVGEWLWEQDAGGHYTYSSAAVQGILGYAPEEIIGRHYLELLTEEDRKLWFETLAPIGQVVAPFRKLINHYRHRDGQEVYTESSGAPIFGPDGRIVKWRGMDQDITARKRYEDALRLRDRAIEAANVGIAIADARQPGYPNIYANPALCRITGYTREELMGRSLRFLQGNDTDEASRAAIREALRSGTACEVIIKNYRKDGAPFWNELLLSPVRDEGGTLTHYIGIQTDVSERRRAEEERRELEIARQIQMSLLPKAPLRLRGFEVAGICVPTAHVGGDYYDFFSAGDNVDLVIADVSGHSVGAALIMAEMRSSLKAELRRDHNEPPATAEILAALNDVLYGDLSGSEFFITMFYLRYELTTRRLRYANAGHNQAVLLRRGATACAHLDAEGLVLGVRREVSFEEKGLVLAPGDRLLMYTDGVTDAQDEAGEFFGLARLCAAFRRHGDQPPEAMIECLLEELRAFRSRGDFEDDISMVAMRIGGNGS
jgi:sigma-B regulation protein RsbU (phosphoserine phosphatase)